MLTRCRPRAKCPLMSTSIGCDLLSISGHKMHGPQGTGALFVRRGTHLEPLFAGGAHERQRRAGTENVAGIVGLGKAAECAMEGLRNGAAERMRGLRDRLEMGLLQHASGVNGGRTARVPNTSNLWFESLDGEALVIALDLKGLAVSSGAACSSGASEPSHVLQAMGLSPERARSSLRLSLHRQTTAEEIERAIELVSIASGQIAGAFGGDPMTIAVAMSGGVDSSTVAAMLKAEGHDLVGLTMQLWNQRRLADKDGMPEQVQGRCCSIDDVYDARRVAEMLSIPYYVVNHQERFERDVIRPFVDEYLSGRTPIPCSLCNNHLKFDQLLLTARQIGAEQIATGHYARNEYDPQRGRWILKRPADASKDQTYFLFGLTQEQLARTLFPLGGFTKPEVRELAHRYGLALANKPDSQEICFIPGGDYKRFIDAYLEEQGEAVPDTAGELVSAGGQSRGKHDGVHNFTVGQRKGLGLASPTPLYVISIDHDRKQVTVGAEQELMRDSLRAQRLNWISIAGLQGEMRAQVKIRHRHEPAWGTLRQTGEDEVEVRFDEPVRAVTPGQAAVFYAADEVIGGGWIV